MTVERFEPSNVIATSPNLQKGGNSSDDGAPTEATAPRRGGIWDED